MISCVVYASNPSPDLLRVTVQSALDAGINEILVVDAGSDVPIVVPRSRVGILRLDAPVTRAAGLNAGIEAARYNWIVRLDVGDALLPEKLRQVQATVAAGARASFSGHVDSVTAEDWMPSADWRSRIYVDAQFLPSTTVFHRAAWAAVDGYDESLAFCEDWDFAVRVERAVGWHMYPATTALVSSNWPSPTASPEWYAARNRERAALTKALRSLAIRPVERVDIPAEEPVFDFVGAADVQPPDEGELPQPPDAVSPAGVAVEDGRTGSPPATGEGDSHA